MIIISPFFSLKEYNEWLPVRLVIILAGLLTIATSYVLYHITMTITQRKMLAIFAFGAYLFSPKNFFSSISGEPVPLSNLLLMTGMFVILKILLDEEITWRYALIFGGVCGLTILSRTDNVVFVISYFILLLLWSRGEKRLKMISIAGLITIFTLIPWILWNLTALGTIKQTSFDACPYVHRVRLLKNTQNLTDVFYVSIGNLLSPTNIFHLFGYSPFYFCLPFLIGSLTGAFKNKNYKLRRYIIFLLTMTGITFILYAIHTSIGFYLRAWHTASFATFTVLIIVCFIHIYFKSNINIKRFLIVLSILYIIIFIGNLHLRKVEPPYIWQTDMYKAADYINKDTNHKFAVYDSGILSYFTYGKVLSIDGNVNPEAYRAVKEHRVYDYMIENNVDYLIGLIATNNSIYEPFWGYPFDEIFEPVSQNEDDMIYKFKYPGYGVCRLKKLK